MMINSTGSKKGTNVAGVTILVCSNRKLGVKKVKAQNMNKKASRIISLEV
jgi:hypothetical protein